MDIPILHFGRGSFGQNLLMGYSTCNVLKYELFTHQLLKNSLKIEIMYFKEPRQQYISKIPDLRNYLVQRLSVRIMMK